MECGVIMNNINFKEICTYNPNKSLELFDKRLNCDEDVLLVIKTMLEKIKTQKNLSSIAVLDRLGEQFAERIGLEVDREDWNAWVSKLYRAKIQLENLFDPIVEKDLTDKGF